MGQKEKKILITLIILCILLPFGMVRSPIEIISHVFPLWGSYWGFVGWWSYTGKPIWQSFLASYGIGSFGIIMLYLGIGVIQTASAWIKNRFGIGRKGKIAEEKKNSKGKRFIRWLGKGSVGLILLVLFIPFPWSDPIATTAMKIKGTKYGLWYLLAVNIPHVYLIVWLAYRGIEIFVS